MSPSVPPLAMASAASADAGYSAVPVSSAHTSMFSPPAWPASAPALSSSSLPHGTEAAQASVRMAQSGDAGVVLERVQALQSSTALESGTVPAVTMQSLQLTLSEGQLNRLLGSVVGHQYQVERLDSSGLLSIAGSADGILALLAHLPEVLSGERQAVVLRDGEGSIVLGRYIYEPESGHLVHTSTHPIGGGASAFALKRLDRLSADGQSADRLSQTASSDALGEGREPLAVALKEWGESTAVDRLAGSGVVNRRGLTEEAEDNRPVTVTAEPEESTVPGTPAPPVSETGNEPVTEPASEPRLVPSGASNTDPVLSDMVSSVTFLENTVNAAAQVVDSSVTLTDPDTGSYGGGRLTVSYGDTGLAEDSLSFDTSGAVGIAGVDVSVGGTVIGQITSNGTAGADLTLALNGNATPARLELLLESLTYANNSDTPAGSRVVTIHLADGAGASLDHAVTVTVTSETDAILLDSKIPDMQVTASGIIAFTYNTSTHFSGGSGTITYAITSLAYSTGDPSTWVTADWTAGGLIIDSNTGIITGIPDVNDRGVVYITVTATDTAMNNMSESFELFLHDGTAAILTDTSEDSGTLTAANDYYFLAGGADTINSDNGSDTVHGGEGDDSINSDTGNDRIYGGQGNDRIIAGTNGQINQDTVFGGEGDDTIDSGRGTDLIYGQDGNDSIYSGSYEFNNSVYGGAGDDTIRSGFHAQDHLFGGDGSDYIYTDAGNDSLSGHDLMYGGAGSDILQGNWSTDYLHGGLDGDNLTGAGNSDIFVYLATNESTSLTPDIIQDFVFGEDILLFSGLGFTGIQAGAAAGTVLGYTFDGTHTVITDVSGNFSIKLLGNIAINDSALLIDNIVNGTTTNDAIHGYKGQDTLYGNDGDDSIIGDVGGWNNDLIYGGAGNDTINGVRSSDIIYGDSGSDSILGGAHGDNTLYGGTGDDTIRSSYNARDYLYGGDGNDLLTSDGANDASRIDRMYGGTGSDTLTGSLAHDTLDGGADADTLTGGTGADVFTFTNLTHSTTAAPDLITDFQNGSDRIDLTGLGFTALSDFETLSYNGTITTLADTQTSFAITFTGDVTALLDNTDFIW